MSMSTIFGLGSRTRKGVFATKQNLSMASWSLPPLSSLKTYAALTCFVSLFTAHSGSASAADGKALFSTTCIACHGSKGEGNTVIGAPNIAGMDAPYLTRQLSNFSAGIRGTAASDNYGAQMRAAVAVLKSDADRVAVASYVASLPKIKATSTFKANLTNGSTQFNAVCSSCHGSRAQGNTQMGAPALPGTDPVYLERQITAFRSGTRGAHKDDKTGGLMRVGANMLPDALSVHDVVGYINTLNTVKP
ncbi:c-type cytochrome [Solimicrobium silvestre]|uniref:Cytochrome c n=1 Tax=Solimicrobium silvestre TaxID=2099400 RepID=A0A2S9GW30_9BURK|nr:c-type cytochrome [Solimicrobium silvestre]PRC91866.1 Cytochrome c [Solimicrobium silvestre]